MCNHGFIVQSSSLIIFICNVAVLIAFDVDYWQLWIKLKGYSQSNSNRFSKWGCVCTLLDGEFKSLLYFIISKIHKQGTVKLTMEWIPAKCKNTWTKLLLRVSDSLFLTIVPDYEQIKEVIPIMDLRGNLDPSPWILYRASLRYLPLTVSYSTMPKYRVQSLMGSQAEGSVWSVGRI